MPAVTAKWAKQSGGPAGDEAQNLVAFAVWPKTGGATDLRARQVDTAPALNVSAEGRDSDRGLFVAALAENQRGEVLETDVAHQLSTGGGKPGQGYPAVRDGMAVRRLLPIECARLQNFPDDWVDGVSDAAAYRMLGNAVCVPVVEWIARRMLEVDEIGRST